MISATVLLALVLPLDNYCTALLSSPPHTSWQRSARIDEGPLSPAFASRCNPLQSRTSTVLNMRPRSRPRRRRRRRVRHGIDGEQDIDNCVIFFREDIDHQGLAKSIDREYAMEKDKLGLSFWDVLKREQERKPEEISEKSRGMSAWARAKRRMTYARGDTESKYALMADRTYGAPELLDQDHLREAPSLDDLNQRPAKFKETYWITPVFRLGVIAASYFAFPLFLEVFHNFETIDAKQFDIVVGQIAPKGESSICLCHSSFFLIAN